MLAYLLLARGGGLREIAWLLVACPFALLAIQGLLLVRLHGRAAIDRQPALRPRLARTTLTFLGIGRLIAIAASLNVVLVSKMVDVTAVATFNAASQLLVPLGHLQPKRDDLRLPLVVPQVRRPRTIPGHGWPGKPPAGRRSVD